MVSATTPSGTTTYLYDAMGLASSAQASTSLAWGAAASIDSTRAIKAVSCTSSTFCVAVGASGYAAIYNGSTWTASDADASRTIDALTCLSSTFCVAGDTSGYAVIYNGTSWGSPSDVDGARAISFISCVSSTFCEAVGASGYAAKYTGTWAASSDIDSTRNLTAVSCVSTSFCEAVDASGYAAKYTSSWASAAVIDSGKDLSALSCTSTSFCEAVDTSGRALKYTGSWGSASSIDSTRAINALTCTSSTFCVAVGASGYAAVYTGTWAASTDVDAARTLAAVSCASPSFCVAVDGSGYEATYTGTWAAASDIDGAIALSGVACPASTYCVAVDGSGNGITYSQPVATLSQLTWDTTSGLPLVIADAADYYVYGPGTTPVEQVSLASSTPTFLNYTPDSSTYLATNAAGDVVGFWGYDAYGNLSYGTPVSAFGYAGQYTDQASGLSNMRARFYQSQTGDFTTRDPAFALTDTAYGYANGDGVNSTDPPGLGGGVGAYPVADWKQEIVAEEGGPSIFSFYGNLIVSPFTSVYRTAVNIYQNGANGCGFFSTKNLEDTTGFVAATTGAVLTVDGAAGAASSAAIKVLDENPLTVYDGLASFAKEPIYDQVPLFVDTPQGVATQSFDLESLAARNQVLGGASLFKGGGINSLPAAESQYFSFESPDSIGYAERYGIPPKSLPFNWISEGSLEPGAPFITRAAPGVQWHPGGATEVVTAPGSFIPKVPQ
jgi:RHS repeat-associated protein